MAEIYIVISDEALRIAVNEGMALIGPQRATETKDVAAALNDSEAMAVILDGGLADKKAFEVLHKSEEKMRRVFIIGDATDAWSTHAAVETFAKPFRLGHLLTRLQLHLRSKPQSRGGAATLGPWRLELQNRQIVHQADNTVVRLTEKETALLDYLAQSEIPVGREELLAAIWGHDGRIDTHTLETHIYQLRRKLDPAGEGAQFLVNEQGAYRLKAKD